MHLLNVVTLKLESFFDTQVPKYAILSHTWGREEVTFADIQHPASPATTNMTGFDKIRKTCERAKIDGYDYAWIDTCCIDKSSSAELTEAINSMFKWYRDSSVCYAYLGDVSGAAFGKPFPRSRWFTRGWTLQELLAPLDVRFFDKRWRQIGTKLDYADCIAEITGIDQHALTHHSSTLRFHCIAKRMSWASNRETTRVEDIAYCLLGIFDVNMPLLYGEGKHAFRRLQEEIIKSHADDSILAWDLDTEQRDHSGYVPYAAREAMCNGNTDVTGKLLAGSPQDFENCGQLETIFSWFTPFTIDIQGIQITLPLVEIYPADLRRPDQSEDELLGWLGLLSCSQGKGSEFLGILLLRGLEDSHKPAKVYRGVFSLGLSFNARTIIVGARAAAQAVRQEIAITQYHLPDYHFAPSWNIFEGCRQYIINRSEALVSMGYDISTVSEINPEGFVIPDGDVRIWDPESSIFTIQTGVVDEHFIRIQLESQDDLKIPTLSVFTYPGISADAIVRIGLEFPWLELRTLYKRLKGKSEGEETVLIEEEEAVSIEEEETVSIEDCEGRQHFITVTMTEKQVCFSRITEVSIDVPPSCNTLTTSLYRPDIVICRMRGIIRVNEGP